MMVNAKIMMRGIEVVAAAVSLTIKTSNKKGSKSCLDYHAGVGEYPSPVFSKSIIKPSS
jgi:hypothetical protein